MKKIVCILIGVALGIWSFLSMRILFIILLGFITSFVICSKANNSQEKRFLCWVFSIAFFLSIIFSSFNFYLAALTKNDSDTIGDASAYSSHGAYIAEVLTKKGCNVETSYTDMEELNWCRSYYDGKLPGYSDYRIGFYAYYCGILYAMFGYSPLMIKFLNAVLGIIGCFLIYFWMRNVFSEKQAKIALLLILFWPSRLLWAASGLKEALIFFAFSLALFVFFTLRKNFSLFWTCVILFAVFIKYNFICVLSLLIIAILLFKRKEIIGLLSSFIFMKLAFFLVYELRPYFVPLLMITFNIVLFTFLKRGKIIILIFCLVVLSIFLVFKIDKNFIKTQYRTITYGMIIDQMSKSQPYDRTKYNIYPNRFYNRDIQIYEIPAISLKELLISYLIGMSYYFLYPFPWALNSKLQLLGYIQMPLLYLLLPFIIIGIIIGFRYHWRETLLYCLFIFLIASIIALVSGNGGTLFRHRDMVMPFFMAFAAIGITKVLGHSVRRIYER